jgi:succinate dehydrogenase / fumarate reductase cytochrome b subunit
MAEAPKIKARPLSPHLQIYRWPLGMAMSILHRMTGAALAVGIVMVVWMLAAAASGPAAWDMFRMVVKTPLGMLALFGWTLALFYHMCNGVRHLVWDTARLFDLKHAKLAGLAVLVAAAALTALLWFGVAG